MTKTLRLSKYLYMSPFAAGFQDWMENRNANNPFDQVTYPQWHKEYNDGLEYAQDYIRSKWM